MIFNTLYGSIQHTISTLYLAFVGEGGRSEACAAAHTISAKHGACFVHSVDLTAHLSLGSSDGEADTRNEIPHRTTTTVNNHSFHLPGNSNLCGSLRKVSSVSTWDFNP